MEALAFKFAEHFLACGKLIVLRIGKARAKVGDSEVTVPARFIAEGPGPAIAAQVVGITDGDTIRVRLNDGSTETVRLIGVDAPESTREVEPYGREAAAYTTRTLEGQKLAPTCIMPSYC